MQYYSRDFNYPDTLTSEVYITGIGQYSGPLVIQIPLLSGQFWVNYSPVFPIKIIIAYFHSYSYYCIFLCTVFPL